MFGFTTLFSVLFVRLTPLIIIRNNDGRDLGSLRFSFMFPCPSNVLSKVDIGSIAKIDAKYANLLGMELSFCRSNEGIIFQKAKSVYTLGLDQGSFLGSKCCDFTKLELACSNYVKK